MTRVSVDEDERKTDETTRVLASRRAKPSRLKKKCPKLKSSRTTKKSQRVRKKRRAR
jgi:hypothetical protein